MGLYQQPNLWQCGPFALKHALVMLGIFAEEKLISRMARANWRSGADEYQLARAAKYYNCELKMVRRHDPDLARRDMVAFLRRSRPCLLCIDDWGHWVTVVKSEGDKFIYLDSRDKAALSIVTWRELKRRWVYQEPDEYDREYRKTIYDFHPVIPKFRTVTRARFSITRARFLRRYENRTFSRVWDDFLADVLNLCKPRTARSSRVISVGEFFRRHREMVVEQVTYWHGGVSRRDAARLLKQFQFVADTYGLVIPEEEEKRVIAGFTALASLWASGKYGIQPLYELHKNGRTRSRGGR